MSSPEDEAWPCYSAKNRQNASYSSWLMSEKAVLLTRHIEAWSTPGGDLLRRHKCLGRSTYLMGSKWLFNNSND